MDISVVMTTYNGEKYVIEQLDSIARQTRQPTEVLIFDDCSTDNTVNTIRSYIEEKHLDFFQLHVNEVNQGWKKNFIKAISAASGDFIFTADQDDIWMLDKIEKMTDAMIQNNHIDLLACNYELLNMRNEKNLEERQIVTMKNSETILPVKITPSFYVVMRPGCTYCFKKDFASRAINIWERGVAHDQLLWIYALISNSLFIYDKPLIKFRRHDGNATGFAGQLDTTRIERAESSLRKARIVEKIYKESSPKAPSDRQFIENYIRYERLRAKALNDRSVISWIKYNLKYKQYVYSLKSSLKDLYYVFQKKMR